MLLYNNPDEFLLGSAKIAVWSILELGIGIMAGSMAHLRPLLKFIPFLNKSSYGAHSYEHGGQAKSGRSGGVKMDTFRSRTVVESGGGRRMRGKRDGDTYIDLKGSDDGDSQKHILDENRERERAGAGIHKVTEVTVTGHDRDSDGDEGTPPQTASRPANRQGR